jgi:hypothetical protein
VKEKIGKEVSLRTVQRYGKEDEKIKQQRTHTITADECKLIIPPSH